MKKVTKNYNLLIVNPELSKQWHFFKNNGLQPDQVTPGSNMKAWWKCNKGHVWPARISSRSKGHGCPYCRGLYASPEYNLALKYPELAKQWHPTKNGDLKPNQVTPHSGKKVWWTCSKGHVWPAIIAIRSSGIGCPFCSGLSVSLENNLSVKFPDIAKQWHPTKNNGLKPNNVTPFSGKKVWWTCSKGHEWPAVIANRSNGVGCPFCAGFFASPEYNLAVKFPALAKQWHHTKNNGLMPEQVTPKSSKKVWWKCSKGHVWPAVIADRSNGTGCLICYKDSFNYKKY
jgi:hypothetical protein